MLIAQRPSEEKRAAKLLDSFESPARALKVMLGALDCMGNNHSSFGLSMTNIDRSNRLSASGNFFQ